MLQTNKGDWLYLEQHEEDDEHQPQDGIPYTDGPPVRENPW